jgi:hypothetical protein
MKLNQSYWAPLALTAALLAPLAALAQTDAPAGSTGACKDGTYTSSATKKGACNKHGGVKDWYAAATAAPAATAPAAAAAPAAAPASMPKAAPAPAPMAKTAPAPAPAAAPAPMAKAAAASTTPAAGGGPGQVWVNTKSNVYHCQGTKYYGLTKEGSYMSEADAKAKGAHADHGKACS